MMRSGTRFGLSAALHAPVAYTSQFAIEIQQRKDRGALNEPGISRGDAIPMAGARDKMLTNVSAGRGLAFFLGFSDDRVFQSGARSGETRRGWDDFRDGGMRLGEQSRGRIEESPDYICGRHGGWLQRLVVIQDPAREHGFAGFLDPLVDQGGDFVSQICSVIQTRKLKTLKGCARSCLQVVEGRCETGCGHGQGSDLRAGPKGPAGLNTCARY
jgi:hypothetical protein